MGDFLYQLKNLRFNYYLAKNKITALNNINLDIPKGIFTCLKGPSGSGKSTLLNLLGLIEPVQEGEIQLNGRSLQRLSEKDKNHIRRHELAFIFQNFHLMPVLNAEENVEFFLIRQDIKRKERMERVKAALDSVGLWEHRKKRPLEMSGGQRQRVAIARAIAKNPKVIIADEPTASLDQQTGREIIGILKDLNHRLKVSIILSSHDTMVQELVPQHIHLQDGRITEFNLKDTP